MNEFLQIILSYPAVPLTVGLGIVLCYWLFVMVGAVGIDLLDGAAEGATKGAAEAAVGALKGAADGVAGGLKGAVEGASGALKGGADGALEAAGGGDDLPSSLSLLAWLGLGKVPVTIAGSALTFSAWFFCVLFTGKLLPLLPWEPGFLSRTLVLALSLLAATLVTSVALRPLHRVFVDHRVTQRGDLRGRVCTISSGRVDKGFGTASIEDGGAGLLLNVVCGRANQLSRGDRALIIDFDAKTETYEIEPIDWLTPEEQAQLDDPARATALAQRARVR